VALLYDSDGRKALLAQGAAPLLAAVWAEALRDRDGEASVACCRGAGTIVAHASVAQRVAWVEERPSLAGRSGGGDGGNDGGSGEGLAFGPWGGPTGWASGSARPLVTTLPVAMLCLGGLSDAGSLAALDLLRDMLREAPREPITDAPPAARNGAAGKAPKADASEADEPAADATQGRAEPTTTVTGVTGVARIRRGLGLCTGLGPALLRLIDKLASERSALERPIRWDLWHRSMHTKGRHALIRERDRA